ncbi:hypothetical protein MB27_29840 [Actinoplanes utahensis]|uniref:Uncharacterized protein n=1 Tax=Actinoplanes utahensis TaxID=1869 RepID=A0A0A6UDX8_ACTUT|nr:hypothetical protein MB27_29840 [Actinoplanes utahensis]
MVLPLSERAAALIENTAHPLVIGVRVGGAPAAFVTRGGMTGGTVAYTASRPSRSRRPARRF